MRRTRPSGGGGGRGFWGKKKKKILIGKEGKKTISYGKEETKLM